MLFSHMFWVIGHRLTPQSWLAWCARPTRIFGKMPYSEKLRPIQPIQTCHTWAEEFQKRNKKKLLHCVRLREVEYREELNNQTFPSLNCGGLTCSYCLSFSQKNISPHGFVKMFSRRHLYNSVLLKSCQNHLFSQKHIFVSQKRRLFVMYWYIYILYIYINLYIHIYIQSSEVV